VDAMLQVSVAAQSNGKSVAPELPASQMQGLPTRRRMVSATIPARKMIVSQNRRRKRSIGLRRITSASPAPRAAEPTSTENLIAQGKAAFGLNQHDVALNCFEEVSGREPKFADVHNMRGLCFAMLDQRDEAVAAFDRALELNSGYVEAHVNRAIVLNEMGRYEEARVSFELASEAAEDTVVYYRYPPALGGQLANMHRDLGDLYVSGGFLSEAAEQYRRACQIRPAFADIRNKLARTLIELGIYEGAVRELRSALAMNPDYLEARANLGLALFRCQDLEGAEHEWEYCLMRQPDDAQVRAYLSMLRRHEEPAKEVSQVA